MSQSIGDRYIIYETLGAGGMGTVYLGNDTHSDQTVAIKQLKSDIAQPETIERFKREGEALRELNHPNIVKMLDMFEHSGQHYLVMEYVTGGDLKDLIKQQEQLDYQRCVDMAIDLADALTRAHRLNIIHRDLKPANVLIGDDGVLRLTDFGVAHVGSKDRVTKTDAIVGTIDYLPPEVFKGETYDTRGDIWAFGVMLFEMLSGQRPFTGNAIFETIQAITTQPIPDLETLCPDTPIALVDLIYRMLDRDLLSRIPSIRIVGAELEAILENRDYTPQPQRFETETNVDTRSTNHNLPLQTTPFVGREHELTELSRMLDNLNLRLITIVAPGGMGKTRLSLQAAEQALSYFDDGVYMVELAPLSEPNSIVVAIAEAIGFMLQGNPEHYPQQILDYLSDQNILLVLDNFEHVLAGADLVGQILKTAPRVKIMATSRQRLNLRDETVFHLSGMEFPEWETPDDALEYAAVKLFMNSAMRVKPDFILNTDNLDAVARICKLVEGMPLGIVLAASWLEMLDSQEIAEEISSSMDFLESDHIDIPGRQRSIRAVMDYSWQQMTDAEQDVAMKLSVFRGGFTRDAARAVAGANLRVLMSLVNKSIIRRDADSGRYQIHELMRQYATDQLESSQLTASARNSHSVYFLDFLIERDADVKGKRQLEALKEIDAENDNIQAAWMYAVDIELFDKLEQAVDCLENAADMNIRLPMAVELIQYAIQSATKPEHHGWNPQLDNVNLRYARWQVLGYSATPYDLAPLYSALDRFREQNQLNQLSYALWVLGDVANFKADLALNLELYEECIAIREQLNDRFYVAKMLIGVYIGYWGTQQPHKALLVIDKSYNLRQEIGDIHGMTTSMLVRCLLELELKPDMNLTTIQNHVTALMKLFQQLNNQTPFFVHGMGFRATIAMVQGQFELAQQDVDKGLEHAEKQNYLDGKSQCLYIRYIIQAIQGHYEAALTNLTHLLTETILPFNITNILWGLSIVHCGLGNTAKTYERLVYRPVLSSNLNDVTRLPIAAVELYRLGKYQQASEILGLASTSLFNGWMMQWDLVSEVIADLRNQLGDDAYKAAYENGQSLDIEATVQNLIHQFTDLN